MYTVKKYIDQGSRSSFYKLNQRGKGFKTFLTKKDAEYAHKIQSDLSENDLAPRVYSEVGRIRIGDALSPWGYITEVAKTIIPHEANCDCEECQSVEESYMDEIDTLVNDIEYFGYNFGDCHVGNVGYVKRNGYNILVCIDTGYESVGDGSGYDGDDYDDDEEECDCEICIKLRKEQYA